MTVAIEPMVRLRASTPAAVAAAVLAAVALALAPAAAGAAAVPLPSPVPTADGAPFPLPGGLAPGAPLAGAPAGAAGAAALGRVVDDGAPRVVVRRVDAATGAPLGDDVAVSDAAWPPAGPSAPVALVHVPAGGGVPGGWLVAWAARDGAGMRVAARRLGEDGAPVGAPFALSGAAAEVDAVALASEAPARRVLAAWSGRPSAGRPAEVTVQGWDPAAGPVAPHALAISSPVGDARGGLAIAYHGGAARHLVVWRGADPAVTGDPLREAIVGRVVAAGGGGPVGPPLALSAVPDGAPPAQPVAATAIAVGEGAAAEPAWQVAWSQGPAPALAVRAVDATGQGPPPRTFTPAGVHAGEAVGGVALAPAAAGGALLAYDAGPPLGVRRVAVTRLAADGAPIDAPLLLSSPDHDARGPRLLATAQPCRLLAAWGSGPGAAAVGRFLWQPACGAPAAAPAPAPPPAPRPSARPPVAEPLALRGLRLTPRVVRRGRAARLRVRVTAPATVVVALRPVRDRRRGRGGARRPRLEPSAATLRRLLVRTPHAVVLRIRARDGRRRLLPAGRYRLVVRAIAPDRRRVVVRGAPLRVVRR